jgi:hypothetical protein
MAFHLTPIETGAFRMGIADSCRNLLFAFRVRREYMRERRKRQLFRIGSSGEDLVVLAVPRRAAQG